MILKIDKKDLPDLLFGSFQNYDYISRDDRNVYEKNEQRS